ncbi:MAG: LytTR family DNA-binding domain-containing protein [Chitinophagales bacterium]|nr:LytTR family DNA-binding domain-containing protein [Chitinophagales bacterium]
MKILIIEDEIAAARRLRKMTGELLKEAEILDVLDSVKSAVKWFREHAQPDLVLMDIHLADGNCFEIVKEVEINCPIIFTTAYDTYAVKAFEVNAIAYLMKPVKANDLEAALKKYDKLKSSSSSFNYQRLLETIQSEGGAYQKRLLIKIGQTIRALEINDIAYFYTHDKIVTIITGDNRKYPADYTLDQLEKLLDPKLFFRINRQFIVSSKAIREMYVISKSRVKMVLHPPVDAETAVSAERVATFKKWLTDESG